MSPFLITMFLTVGACTWIYTKLQKHTGNDTQRSLIATAAAGIVIFTISFYIFNLLAGSE